MDPAIPDPRTPTHRFDLLRLLAAGAVLVSHSYALVGDREPGIGRESLGNIAVLVFFSISGFLIAQSWRREPRLGVFVAKRGLRIMPALVVVLLVTAFVIGPLLTTLGPGTYLRTPETWRYVLDNTFMHTAYQLPGVFTSNPTSIVNGSLWTLKHEVLCYLAIAALGVVALLRARLVATIGLLALFGLLGYLTTSGPAFFDQSMVERAFVIAVLLQLWHAEIPRSWPLALLLLAAWAATVNVVIGDWLATIAIPYATILVASALPAASERWMRGNDVSYGLYLWAFPVQQVIVAVAGITVPLLLVGVALPITVACALASWVLIEHPSLRLKSRLTRGMRTRRARAEGAPAAARPEDGPAPAPVRV